MQKSWIRILTVLIGFIFAVTAIGGFFSGCKQAKKKEETKQEKKSETKEEKKVEFENPDLLVNTDWLEKNLPDKNVQIIDVRTEGEYAGGHIEGAVNLPIPKTVDAGNPIAGMVVPKATIESLLSDLGISNDSKIVVYDGGGTPYAGRVFWILEYYGHKKVSVLDGGIKEWQKEGKKIKFDAPEIKKTTYKAKANPNINATTSQVAKWVEDKDKDVVLVDTRTQEEYDSGHLPGAIRLDWTELSTAGDPPLLKPAAELQTLFDNAGITRDKDMVLY